MAAIAPTLPLEIWSLIASYVPRRDLHSLARTSQALCHISREKLARSIKLTHSRYSKTFAQLGSLDLFRHVRELTIEWHPGLEDECRISVADMKHLWHIRIFQDDADGPLWITQDAQIAFVQSLNDLPKLETFEFEGYDGAFASDEFPLAGLKSLTWSQSDGIISPQYLSVCQASQLTLSTLSLTALLDDDYLEELTSLFSFHFIALTTLSMSPVIGSDADISLDVSTAFNSFLLKHDTLQNLELRWMPSNTNEDDLPLASVWVPTESLPGCFILPRLQTFAGSPLLLTRAIENRVDFVKTLQKLVFVCAEDDFKHEDTKGMDEMMSELVAYRDSCGPLSLRTWVFQLSVWETRYCAYLDRDSFVAWFKAATYVFSELETFIGDIYDMDVVLETFPGFQKLRTLSCAKHDLELEDVRILAAQILTLETVRCFKSGLTFTISRDSAGTISIHERYVDIPDDEVEDYQYLDEADPDESYDRTRDGWEYMSDLDAESDRTFLADKFAVWAGSVLFRLRRESSAHRLEVCLMQPVVSSECILPKCRKNRGETIEEAAIRTTYELTGYKCSLWPQRMETCAPAPGASDVPVAVEVVDNLVEPVAVTIRQQDSDDSEGCGIKIIHWFISLAEGGAENLVGLSKNKNWESQFILPEQALKRLSIKSEREVVGKALEIVQEGLRL